MGCRIIDFLFRWSSDWPSPGRLWRGPGSLRSGGESTIGAGEGGLDRLQGRPGLGERVESLGPLVPSLCLWPQG